MRRIYRSNVFWIIRYWKHKKKEFQLNLNSNSFEWSNLIETELHKAIFIFATNKVSKSDQLTFLIIQKAYKTISDVFFIFYSELINKNHHSLSWKEEIEAILKKWNKSDYTTSKAYRIISLLNCLRKISEKIMTSRLSYFEQISDLLDSNQMNEWKELSAINAVINLTHDIELLLKEKKSTTCVFLNCQQYRW